VRSAVNGKNAQRKRILELIAMARLTLQKSRIAMLNTSIAKVPQIEKRAAPFYLSPQWRALLASILKQRGRSCEAVDCLDPRASGVRYGDHIRELSDGGAPLDADNIQVLCARCHGKKTAKAKRDRGPA
jgi:5-methylcytosine-specific restriction protein A